MMKNTESTRRRYIEDRGINGSAHQVFAVVTEWTDARGRDRSHRETFDTRAEAEHWMKWA